MNPITYPLVSGDDGPAVKDLQEALIECLERRVLHANNPEARDQAIAKLRDEQEEGTFRDATKDLLSRFQESRHLEASGKVDEDTAKALNDLLREWGLFDREGGEAPARIVAGFVTPSAEAGARDFLAGLVVRAFHVGGSTPIRLGEDIADRMGRFTIRYEMLPGLPGVDLKVSVEDPEGRLLAESAVIPNAKPLETLNIQLSAQPIPWAQPQQVAGIVRWPSQQPAPGVALRLVRLAFGGKANDVLLAEAVSAADGRFVLPYSQQKASAHFEVRQLMPDGSERALTSRLGAWVFEQGRLLELVAHADGVKVASEYQRMSEDVAGEIGQVEKLVEAVENTERQDITLLARSTGWDARLLALNHWAQELAMPEQGLGMSAEALYGLLRVGLPADKQLLAAVDADDVEAGLAKATESNIIALDADTLKAQVQAFSAFAAKALLADTAPGSQSSYAELLATTGLSEAEQHTFGTLYFAHRGDADSLWDKALAAGFSGDQVKSLQLHGKLAFLAGNSAPMTQRLMNMGLEGPAALASKGFYTAEAWADELFDEAGIAPQERASPGEDGLKRLAGLIPPAYAGASVLDRAEVYTADMARKVHLAYPTPVLLARLKSDERFALADAHDETVELLERCANEGYRLGQTPVSVFLEQQGLTEAELQSAPVKKLKALHATYSISQSDEAQFTLLKMGLESAYDVTNLTQERFVRTFNAQYHKLFMLDPAERLALAIYSRARQVSSVTFSLFGAAQSAAGGSVAPAIPSVTNIAPADRAGLIRRLPNLETLIGSMDYCECQSCDSVLGPSAYFVDLLQLVDIDDQVWARTLAYWKLTHGDMAYPHVFSDGPRTGQAMKPYDVLVERRPDLPHLLLDCENTHTALPYIDLVNEILEYHAAHGQLSNAAVRDTGDATTEELLAEPQNVIVAAYDALRAAKYPLGLPFDRSLELVREFCAHAETPLPKLLHTLRRDDADALWGSGSGLGQADIFIESLGMSPDEAALFTRPAPLRDDAWHDLYGWPALRAAIQSPTSGVETSVALADADANTLSVGMLCGYFDVGTNVDSDEINEITSVGTPGSGGAGLTKLIFAKAWGKPPVAGDLMLLRAPAMLRSAKLMSRRLGLSYKEMTQVVGCGFVNPGLNSLSLLYRVGLSIGHAYRYKVDSTALTPPPATPTVAQQSKLAEIAAFEQRLKVFAAEAGNTLEDLKSKVLAIDFGSVLVLSDEDAGCNFDLTRLQHADGSSVLPIELVRFNLFVRLWRRLGWSMDDTDRALQGLSPKSAPFDGKKEHLDKKPLASALVHLAHLKALDERLKLGTNRIQKLLTFWGDIPTKGNKPLYAQMFLRKGALKAPAAFDSALGDYLSDPLVPLADHVPTLQAVTGLTVVDVDQVLQDAGTQLAGGPPGTLPQAKLTLSNVSLLYRHALLAKAMKIGVRDLLTLRKLSGIDPFKELHPDPLLMLAEDYPHSQTLAFLDLLDLIRSAGLKVSDVDALVRHRLEGTTLIRGSDAELQVLLKTLAEGVQSIRAEHAVPNDPGSISDEILQSKLGLVLAPDVAGAFLSMLNGNVSYGVTEALLTGELPLTAEGLAGAAGVVEAKHDPVLNLQHFRYRGVLLDAQREALESKYPLPVSPATHQRSPLLERLLKKVAQLPRDFFNRHLIKSEVGTVPESGFLEKADFETLFKPTPANEADAAKALEERRMRSVRAFFPYLQKRLVQQLIVQTMVARTGADPVLVERLLSDKAILNTPNPLLDSLSPLGRQGLTVSSFKADGQALGSVFSTSADTSVAPKAPADTVKRVFEGTLQVPTSGAWRFFIELDKENAEAELRFPHRTDAVLLEGTAPTVGSVLQEFTELQAGVLYHFQLVLSSLGNGDARLLVQGDSLGKGPLSRLTLRAADDLAAAAHAVALLEKALLLLRTVGLDEVELRHVSNNAASFGGLALGAWPTQRVGDDAADTIAASIRLAGLRRLLQLGQLKKDLGISGNELVSVFEANALLSANKLNLEVYPRLAKLTALPMATVQATAEALWARRSFASDLPVRRLWAALQLVQRFGVDVSTLSTCALLLDTKATEPRRAEVASALKNSIKARAGEQNWPRIAQPIYDRLRQRQRDALVAHAIHKLGYERLEELYEHFLIDPGMEPVVQTSRMRLAITALQQFIPRCFLNVEPKVEPSVLDAKRWEWMRRYPVWAGNRKLWLFPENVLEPEFRDDKTPLFEALEGALLQGDVSNDLVENALLAYLRGLDEIARLDMVAMHVEDHVDTAQRVLHVFGRTYSHPHKYFYRRLRSSGWSTWEPVGLHIEGDHLAPVVWRGRLFLFWVTFLEKDAPPPKPKDRASEDTVIAIAVGENARRLMSSSLADEPSSAPPERSPEPALAQLSLSDLVLNVKKLNTKKLVELQLHWAQYQSDAWTKTESSGFDPVVSQVLPISFSSSSSHIHVSKEFTDGVEGGVFVHLSGFEHTFYLAGRNASPERGRTSPPPRHVIVSADTNLATRRKGKAGQALTVRYTKVRSTDPKTKSAVHNAEILGQMVADNTVLGCNNALSALGVSPGSMAATSDPAAAKALLESGLPELAALTQPFFCQDNKHTFFVRPLANESLLEENVPWLLRFNAAKVAGTVKSNRYVNLTVAQQYRKSWPLQGPPTSKALFGAPNASVESAPEWDWLANSSTLLAFDQSTVLGDTGQLGLKLIDPDADPVSASKLVGAVQLHPASALELDSAALVMVNRTELNQSLGMLDTEQVVLLGKTGLNSQLSNTLSGPPNALRRPLS